MFNTALSKRLGSSRILAMTALSLVVLVSQSAAQEARPSAQAALGKTASAPPIPPLPQNYQQEFKINRAFKLRGRLAFSASVYGSDRLFVLDLDNQTVQVLIDGPGRNFSPSWSPDGRALAFVSDRTGRKQVYISDWTGEHQRLLTSGESGNENPDWSPDGKWIAFNPAEDKASNSDVNIYAIHPDGSGRRQITSFKGRNSAPRWSPDGQKIAYVTDRFWPGTEICFWNLERRMESCPLHGKITYTRQTWSPAGDALAYSYGTFNRMELAILRLREGSEDQLPHREGRNFDLTWISPAQYLAFSGESAEKGHFNLFLYSSDSREISPLVTSRFSMRFLSWNKETTLSLEVSKAKDSEKDSQTKP